MAVEIRPVRDKADLKRFIEFPWRVYSGNPHWAPPIKSMIARLLDEKRHPFWQTASRELFLAVKDGEVLGRIAAIVDRKYNEFQNQKMGAWGFFECLNKPEAAARLFGAAEGWLREHGMTFIRGPLNPSANYEIGTLIEGFDKSPAFMLTYNPAYYLELIRLCGYSKEKDLFSFRFTTEHKIPDWVFEVSKRLTSKGEVSVRTFSSVKEGIAAMGEIGNLYNRCWADNWGFSPMSPGEMDEMAHGLKALLDPDLAFIINYQGKQVGMAVLVPDLNPFLKRLDGKLGISALYKKFKYLDSDLKGIRGLLFGVLEEYRQMGIPLVAFQAMIRAWEKTGRYSYAELGWNLEDNQAINLLYEEGGMKPDKKYRIYRKELA